MKIAVNISGQTRWHNLNEQWFYPHLEKLLEGFEYDLYGHTWDYCEKPNAIEKFTNFIQTDQNEIWDKFVKYNIFDRIAYRTNWIDLEEYNDALNGKTDFLEFCKKTSFATYGQIWSWYECMKTIPTDDYDLILRWRWDIDAKIDPHHIFEFQTNIRNFSNKQGEYNSNLTNSDVLTMSPMVSGTMHDTCFAMRAGSFKHFDDIENQLDRVVRRNLPDRFDAHELWFTYLSDKSTVAYGLPQIVTSLKIIPSEMITKKAL